MLARAISSAAAAGSALLLGVLLLLAPGCRAGASTPRELVEEMMRLNERADTGAIWDLYSPKSREEFRRLIDRLRVEYERNPGARNLVQQFNVTWQEFLVLPPEELFRRENLGRDQWFVGGWIVDEAPDPQDPRDVVVTVELNPQLDTRLHVTTTFVEGQGWMIRKTAASK